MKKALFQIHIAVLLWGFTGVLGKAITLSTPVLVWYRMLLTAVIMSFILTYRKQWAPVARADFKQMALVGLLMGLHWVAFYGSIKFSNASIALVCLSTTPVFTTIFNQLIHKNKYDLRELLLGVIALTGMYLIYQFQQFYALGIAAGVIAALLAALFTVLNKRIAHKYPSRTMVFYEMSTGLVFVTLLMPIQIYYVHDTILLPKQMDWVWLLVLSLCCTVWAQSLALNALKSISSFTATLSVNLEPVYGIILAFIIYNENSELHPGFFAGMALILLSVLLQIVRLLKPVGTSAKEFIKQKGGID
jgi:drug/metabolite transporter (DMT)-like permease